MDDPRRRSKLERQNKKRELELELRSILAQKQAIEERQSVLREAVAAREAAAVREAEAAAAREAAAAAAAAQKQREKAAQLSNGHREKSSSKRSLEPPTPVAQKPPALSPQEEYEAKKKQAEAENQRRQSNIWSQCSTILKALKKTTQAWPFLAPVDVVKLNIPDYFNIVKKPMDLGTIEKKLTHNPSKNTYRQYDSPLEFRDDVRQVWENCRLYNRPGQHVRNMGDKLSDSFERKWAAAGIEQKMKEDRIAQTRAEMELAEMEAKLNGGAGQSGDYVKKMRMLSEELREELENTPPTEVSGRGGKMTFEQKRRMSVALGSLPGDMLYRVLEIISESAKSENYDDQDEVELDIDSLDDETLWKLQDYVDSIIPAHSVPKAPSKSAPTKQPAAEATSAGHSDGKPSNHNNKPAEQHAKVGGKIPAGVEPSGAGTSGGGGSEKGSDSNSSSSSSDGSSSSSGSDTDGAEQHGSTFNAGDGANSGGGRGDKSGRLGDGNVEMSALVSATRPAGPSQPSILKSHASSKKEVNLQNANAWASLTEGRQEDDDEHADATDAKPDRARQGTSKSAKGDDLWSEFTAREQQQKRREQERIDEERQRDEQERAKAERARADAKEEQEARRRHDEMAEEESRKAREEERAKELAKLSNMGKGARDLGVMGGDDEMIKPVSENALALLGLSMKHDDDDDDDSDDDEDMEDGDMEDGEFN